MYPLHNALQFIMHFFSQQSIFSCRKLEGFIKQLLHFFHVTAEDMMVKIALRFNVDRTARRHDCVLFFIIDRMRQYFH